MKKTLIALAALAAVGSAFADGMAAPTITPYARLDVGLQNTNTTGSSATTTVGNAGYNGSNFGVKAETDLGSGLKGFAQLEEGFNSQDPSNGFTNGNGKTAAGVQKGATNRVAMVGVGGGWGRVDLGNVWGPYDNTTQEAMNYNAFSPYGIMLNSGAHGDNGNGTASGSTVGSIQYTTPTISGVTGTFNYAPKKDANGNDISATAADVTYVAGPLNVAFAYEHQPSIYQNDTVAALSTAYSNAWHISAMYDLKTVLLSAALSGASVDGVTIASGTGTDKDTGYSLSAAVPMGQWTPSFGVASVKTSGDLMNQTATSFGAQALYAMNKVATFYVGVRSTATTYNSGAPNSTTTYVASGLTFSF